MAFPEQSCRTKEEEEMYLIAGLGNPGKEYAGTRHNMGYSVITELAKRHDISASEQRMKTLYGKGRIGSERVILAEPLTYMNLSGESVRSMCEYFKVDPFAELIVIYDDISLAPGQIRVRPGGSAGGHNGMKSIIKMLGGEQFMRIRVGIGEKPKGWDLADYVLGRPSAEEQVLLADAFVRAADAVEMIISRGVDAAMNIYNAKSAGVKE